MRGSISVFVNIPAGKVYDVDVHDLIHWLAGSIVVDLGCVYLTVIIARKRLNRPASAMAPPEYFRGQHV